MTPTRVRVETTRSQACARFGAVCGSGRAARDTMDLREDAGRSMEGGEDGDGDGARRKSNVVPEPVSLRRVGGRGSR